MLAIGIVVDDAIVVVENVERVMEQEPHLDRRRYKKAMAEITAPIIGITLVLLSVFVPVAFIPGITGELFRQFAVTIAVSMFLSAINALTLSPALCARVPARHEGPRRGIIGYVMRAIDMVRDRYGDVTARLVRVSVIGVVMSLVAGGRVADGQRRRRAFAGGRPGRVLRRRAIAGRRIRWTHRSRHETGRGDPARGTCAAGHHLGDRPQLHRQLFAGERGFMVVTLKSFEDRKDPKDSAAQMIAQLGQGSAPKSAKARWCRSPAADHRALGTGGGFAYVLEDLQAPIRKKDGAGLARGLLIAANEIRR